MLAAHGAGAVDGATVTGADLPAISIIIDDLGYRRPEGLRALELPGALTYAVLPHTPFARRLAEIAHQLDKEVLLHLPMEGNPEKALGPGALTAGMTPEAFESMLDAGLAAVPHARGLNNHMGSVLTADAGAMRALMRWMRTRRPLFFVDSVTTPRTVALRAAHEAGIDAAGRDVFLDADPVPRAIRQQFMRLVAVAHAHGTALGIGHPYPETLRVLEQVLSRPERVGVVLVSVSELIARRAAARADKPRRDYGSTRPTALSVPPASAPSAH